MTSARLPNARDVTSKRRRDAAFTRACFAHSHEAVQVSSVSQQRVMDSDEEIAAAMVVYCIRRRRRRGNRRHWVHPFNSTRLQESHFFTIVNDLRQNPEEFFDYFQMSEATFNELLSIISLDVTGQTTAMRVPVSAQEKLAITLRYFITGCTFKDLHQSYRLGTSTISKIVPQVCEALWKNLGAEWLPLPTKEHFEEIADGFRDTVSFPNCLGAVGGRLIEIMKPAENDSISFAFKKFFSILLLVVCDADLRITHVEVVPAPSNDNNVFKNSQLFKDIDQEVLDIPHPKPLPGTDQPTQPFIFVGDEGFGLSKYLLTPYKGKNLTDNRTNFNHRLRRVRRCIDSTFGILSNKWQIFARPQNVAEQLAIDIAKTCCLLHNIVRERDGLNFDDTLTENGFLEMPRDATQRGRIANDIRESFSEYFASPQGELSWRRSKTT